MQLGSKCFRDVAAVIKTLKKPSEISPPAATRRGFNMNVRKHLARQRPASRIYVVYILWFYYILIPIWLPNAEVFAQLPKIHWKSPSYLFSSPFLPTGSKRDGAKMVPKWAHCALGCVNVILHLLCWEHWLNLSPLGLQVRVWVDLAWHW